MKTKNVYYGISILCFVMWAGLLMSAFNDWQNGYWEVAVWTMFLATSVLIVSVAPFTYYIILYNKDSEKNEN